MRRTLRRMTVKSERKSKKKSIPSHQLGIFVVAHCFRLQVFCVCLWHGLSRTFHSHCLDACHHIFIYFFLLRKCVWKGGGGGTFWFNAFLIESCKNSRWKCENFAQQTTSNKKKSKKEKRKQKQQQQKQIRPKQQQRHSKPMPFRSIEWKNAKPKQKKK